ncbi:V-type ATP synthase subunit D [bacterium 210917-SL.2.15]|nr:V-type ATP synthase subunit D [bacterium 210917-SL.2.15]
MAQKMVNPTRMELGRLKQRLRTAQRGHKLLKDKRDEMMRRLLEQVHRARTLRRETGQMLASARAAQNEAAAALSPAFLAGALLYPAQTLHLDAQVHSGMGVALPAFSISAQALPGRPYGYAQTDGALDEALSRLHAALPKLLELAEAEKTVHCMARELEAARRRVNALEYVLIPELQEQIRRIAMKLEENERGNIVRLMKVKELVLAEARTQRFGAQ